MPGLRLVMLLFVGLFASFMLFSFPRVMLFGGLVQGGMLILLFLCALTFPFVEPAALVVESPAVRPELHVANC